MQLYSNMETLTPMCTWSCTWSHPFGFYVFMNFPAASANTRVGNSAYI